jgi:hypothetical protein
MEAAALPGTLANGRLEVLNPSDLVLSDGAMAYLLGGGFM